MLRIAFDEITRFCIVTHNKAIFGFMSDNTASNRLLN